MDGDATDTHTEKVQSIPNNLRLRNGTENLVRFGQILLLLVSTLSLSPSTSLFPLLLSSSSAS